jgi:hypothetical protein
MKGETAAAKVLSNFFTDGAKILFGSMVVGMFVSTSEMTAPFATAIAGIGMAAAFLAIAIFFQKKYKETPRP